MIGWAAPPRKQYRIDLDVEGDCRAVCGRFGPQDVCRSEREGELIDAIGMLAEQVSKISSVWSGSREKKEHGYAYPVSSCAVNPV